ncbi:MAG: UDP-N-acetylglucosamine--N-acetylmuramyl-(pentapeptide) pyrophosphoryl-undecaprenol N-acetylglucosamine transferase [Clostridia bacterium]|nr:UDP-N-acetylglucosamine--N-acetylmuramyl-(pentapeptide) pyrophosphoryl-undecaprenol N-acetylglucosamine transferase [Clostridia bacterium]
MQKIVFTGGGSAGHVLPNVAIIEALKQASTYDLYYFGTSGIERSIIAPLKLPYFCFETPKLKRGGSFAAFKNNLSIPFRLLAAVKRVKKALKEIRPDLVFSKGGYVALPVVLAAAQLKIPCLSHESDLTPGLANRLMQRRCKEVLTAFPETADRFQNGRYCGQPLRSSLFGRSRTSARKIWAEDTTRKVLLVFGGGSGSAALNEAIRKHASTLCQKYYLIHVCGRGNGMESKLKNYRQVEFIEDMGGVYAAADLIISRAGAGAIFEAIALKKPALLIPLEGQTRGDQKENAAYFLRRGLCHVLPQSDLDRLPEKVEETLQDTALYEALLRAPYQSGTTAAVAAVQSCLQTE